MLGVGHSEGYALSYVFTGMPLKVIVGPHFGPGLGLEDKPKPGSSFCSLLGEPKPGLSFETCLSHFRIRVTQEDLFGPPCLCPATVADVELCHWP